MKTTSKLIALGLGFIALAIALTDQENQIAGTIHPRVKRNANRLGVEVKPSTLKNKKLDVYKDGQKIASVGAKTYKDYPTYLDMEKAGEIPKGTAQKRKKAYKARHQQYRTKKGTPSYYADQLLWT